MGYRLFGGHNIVNRLVAAIGEATILEQKKDASSKVSEPTGRAGQAPSISLPKGGGAIRGIGEKFAANPATGTGSMTVPIATSPGRAGFGPQLSLSYDSGSGNGPFGFGWRLALPSITRKTDKGLPQYSDAEESDVFILSGAEDLVPALKQDDLGNWAPDEFEHEGYEVKRYRPRIEGLFARIERWTKLQKGEVHWRSISRDNVTTVYGQTDESRIADPTDFLRIFGWLICASYDDKGNAISYEYAEENDHNVDRAKPNERNRVRTANRYLKRIKYGNRKPNRDVATWEVTDPAQLPADTWMFEIVFDYGEGHYAEDAPDAQGRLFVRARIDPPAGSHWPVRQDPFSTYRAGFEVRTYRLCRRVLVFHRFPHELGIDDCLVRSTEFTYSESPVASFITSVTQSGYIRKPIGSQLNRYLKRSLPPLEFEYSRVPSPEELANQPIHEVDAQSLVNLPDGLNGSRYQWVDLDGEGLSGVLTEQAGGWYYKRNLSANNLVREDGRERAVARFGPLEIVTSKPAGGLAGGGHFLDLAGDGQVDLVRMEGSLRGFYERTGDACWGPFQPFDSWPDLNTRDPNLRFVDMSGDGRADMLITEGDFLIWYPSLAEEGFGPAVRVSAPKDEEKGPRLVFSDAAQSVYLADLSGDGLSDLVRIRNGEVCYWPNLGYGKFGPKVTMDNAPRFDSPDQFDQRRIRLADTDGSGATDILYIGRGGVRIYFNQNGNAWSDAVALPQFPSIDNLSSVQVLDLLGNGTACLVWSSPLPDAARQPMRYLALMEEKPHLLAAVKNNLGAETRVHYAPSTKFYLADKQAGRPWITKLPFPVHVVERVETFDRISRNLFVTRYSYHHGHFDGVEQEFRGFGFVEQFDTEALAALSDIDAFPAGDNVAAESYVPPVYVKTWFHTGLYLGRDRVSNFFAGLPDENDHGEYYREPGLDNEQASKLLLRDTALPTGLGVDEEREACRALKGSILRREIYALDGSDKQGHPYAVTEQNFTVEPLQPLAGNRHAVFFTHSREALSYHYERNPADPRISHALTLEVDSYGNALKELTICYGRRHADPELPLQADRDKQTTTLITYAENRVTNPIDDPAAHPNDYRTPLPVETRTYELTGLKPKNDAVRFSFDEWVENDFALPKSAVEIAYEESPNPSRKEKRLIEHVRTLYRKNDLTDLLPLGSFESLGLAGESYRLAFTQGLLTSVYQRPRDGAPTENLLPAPEDVLGGNDADRGGYVVSQDLKAAGVFPSADPDDHWWTASGQAFLSPNTTDTAAQELDSARKHFFLGFRYRDPFGHTTTVAYDAYDLLMIETTDALGNRVTVGERNAAGAITREGNDYRALLPVLVTDPNRNRSEVVLDALGMVVGTAVKGKDDTVGDSLSGFEPDLTQAQIDGFYEAADPHLMAPDLLKDATTRVIYDLDRYRRTRQASPEDPTRWLPVYAAALAREIHSSDSLPPEGLKIQITFSYSDGFGREIQKKVQAEPGPLAEGGPIVSPRWVGSGWTIFNNKGKPVRQYEPFFSQLADKRHQFEFGVQVGVSPILFYDPVERVVATLHPNDTYEKVVFTPWRQKTYDVNDTVAANGIETGDPRTDPDIKGNVAEYFKTKPGAWQTWYQQRITGAKGAQEKRAAEKAAEHANTPATVHLDTLGRPFLTIAHNGFQPDGAAIHLPTRVEMDIEGNQRAVTDARDIVVMRYDYDMLGNRIHQKSTDAGDRWMLNDVAGKPLYAFDSRGHRFRTTYDELRRPIESYMREGAGAELLVERTIYGEGRADPEANNLRGKAVEVCDQAGIVNSEEYDFRGNLVRSARRLAREYKATLNWSGVVALEDETFSSRTRHDALNRVVQMIAPHSDGSGTKINVVQPVYNEANLLERVNVWLNQSAEPTGLLDPATADLHAVTDIDYDAKGHKKLIDYGNGVTTTFEYDPLTYRLTNIKTVRGGASPADRRKVQDLFYTYDPAGNITHIRDDAQQKVYFNNQVVEARAEYTYDAIYRLIEAAGREYLEDAGRPTAPDATNSFHTRLDHPRDGKVMGSYVEQYVYDAVGNILSMRHRGSDPQHAGWKRCYQYAVDSNRLLSTSNPDDPHAPDDACPTHYSATPAYAERYEYDAHGNITQMLHLPLMQWNYRDQLQATAQQVVASGGTPEITYYVYDAQGQRVRKITEAAAVKGASPARKSERIYFASFDVYREYSGGASSVKLERETLHVMDDKQRIALVETRTQGDDGSPAQLVRYQFGNQLGSACLELDQQAQVISYEEYYPYGSTSYQAVRRDIEVPPKRYRYSGLERDDETGLEYHSARYYLPWLGRWASSDPIGIRDSINSYQYVSDNPVKLVDLNGLSEWHVMERFLGAVKAIGGVMEVIAGVAMIGSGFFASGVGVGIAVAAGGTVVTLHGLDTVRSGLKTVWSGEDVDTETSSLLQRFKLSKTTANLIDAGFGSLATLGAGAAARAVGRAGAAIASAAGAASGATDATPAVARAVQAAKAAPKPPAVSAAVEASPSVEATAAKAATKLRPEPAVKYSTLKEVIDNIDPVPSATEHLPLNAAGIAHPEFIPSTRWWGKLGIPESARVVIQLLDTALPGTRIHEIKHAKDYLEHPVLTWYAVTRHPLPGRGLGFFIMESRGYWAEGVRGFIPARIFPSMSRFSVGMYGADRAAIGFGSVGGQYVLQFGLTPEPPSQTTQPH